MTHNSFPHRFMAVQDTGNVKTGKMTATAIQLKKKVEKYAVPQVKQFT